MKKRAREESAKCPGPGESLFYDDLGARFFTSTDSKVSDAMYKLNKILICNGWATVYDYYCCLGIDEDLSESDKRIAHTKGWSSIDTFESGMKEVQWLDYGLVDETINNETHTVLRIMYPPEYLDTYHAQVEMEAFLG